MRPKQQHLVKFTLPDNTCPGGVGNLIGLIIGPRGKTQQRLQNETVTVLVVRGKGASKTASGMIDDQDEEETHVRITGPDDASVNKALAMVQLLIDFNSEEGEALRNAQLRELRVLNGTLQEDKDVDYKALFTNPQRAAITGPLGNSAAIRQQLALPAPLSSPIVAATSTNEESQYAQLMAEIGGLDETDAPATGSGGAPPPAAAASQARGLATGLPRAARLPRTARHGRHGRHGRHAHAASGAHADAAADADAVRRAGVRAAVGLRPAAAVRAAVRAADADADADAPTDAAADDAAADADADAAADAVRAADADAVRSAASAAAAGLPGSGRSGSASDATGLRSAHNARSLRLLTSEGPHLSDS